jgi:hypothetical protein
MHARATGGMHIGRNAALILTELDSDTIVTGFW